MPRNLLKRLSGWFLLIGGLAMLGGGIWFGVANFSFVRGAERASGTVIEIVGERGARGTTLYFAMVRFRPAGRDTGIVFKAGPGMWPSPFSVGDAVTVAYERDDGDDAMIVSFWTVWFLPLAMAGLGMGCLIAGGDTLRKTV